jgi:hypothetical protein
MSITLDQICPAIEGTAATLSATFTNPPAAGSLVAVGIAQWDSGGGVTVNKVEDNQGNTYYQAKEQLNGSMAVAIYYAKNVTTGTPFTITVTFNGAPDAVMGACSYIGVDKTNPLSGTPNSNIGTGVTANTLSTTPVGDAVYFGVSVFQASAGIAAIDPFVKRFGTSGVPFCPITGADQIASGEKTAYFTGNNVAWTACIAAFKEDISSAETITVTVTVVDWC